MVTHAFQAKPDCYSPREVRHLDYVSQFTTDIRHVSGKENTVANAFSRLNINILDTTTSIDFNRLAKEQQGDEEFQHLRASSTLLKFYCSFVLLFATYPLAFLIQINGPAEFRRFVFDALHNLSHPVIRATQYLVTQRFVWCGINLDVRNWSRACLWCQRAKIHRHTVTAFVTFATPDVCFDYVHIDLVGPFPLSGGNTYLLTF